MERSTAVVLIIVTIFASILFGIWGYFGHQDNNRQKQVVETCIREGGEPLIQKEQFIGCNRN